MKINLDKYFQDQTSVTEEYIIPFIGLNNTTSILEVGCGHGGNLFPFMQRHLNVTGCDISKEKINFAREKLGAKVNLLLKDIFEIEGKYDLIILKDTLEHIHNKKKLINHLMNLLNANGRIFISFPPWRMPFGGHQQWGLPIPYIHLLPLYKFFLNRNLREVRECRISIRQFKKLVKNYNIVKKTYFLINPSYKYKFGLTPKILPKILDIPFLRDFYITTVYCIVRK